MRNKYLKLASKRFVGGSYQEFLEASNLKLNFKSVVKIEKEITSLNQKKAKIISLLKTNSDEELAASLHDINEDLEVIKSFLWMFFADVLVKNFPYKLQISGVRVEVKSYFDNDVVYPTKDATIAINQSNCCHLSQRYLEVEAHSDCAVYDLVA